MSSSVDCLMVIFYFFRIPKVFGKKYDFWIFGYEEKKMAIVLSILSATVYTLKLGIFQFGPVKAITIIISKTGQNLIPELITFEIMENYFKVLMYLNNHSGS